LLDGVADAPESLCGVAVPVVLLGVALSCTLDGDAGVEGVVVVLCVVLLSVVVLLGVVAVLCARAMVPVRSNPAA
jgi:hypothetical protein